METKDFIVINHSFYQVYFIILLLLLLLSFSIYSVGNSVTPCDIRSDRVTSHAMSQDMSHIV